MNGICKHCGKPMQWTGSIRIFCEHCGGGQLWPTDAEEELGS